MQTEGDSSAPSLQSRTRDDDDKAHLAGNIPGDWSDTVPVSGSNSAPSQSSHMSLAAESSPIVSFMSDSPTLPPVLSTLETSDNESFGKCFVLVLIIADVDKQRRRQDWTPPHLHFRVAHTTTRLRGTLRPAQFHCHLQ